MVRIKLIISTVLCLGLASVGNAQEIEIKGTFFEDSFKIGENILYSLRIQYPKDRQVIFTDSLYTYEPFEYVSKQYFDTKVSGELAIDCVVYQLTAYEIDPWLTLQLPVFLLTKGDSIALTPEPDTIFTETLIPILSDTLQVKTNTSFIKVPTAINYPLLGIATGFLVVIALLTFLIFGKSIRKWLLLRKIRKAYEKFVVEFDINVGELLKNTNIASTENVLTIWKKYLEKLEQQPYTKLTTKELLASGVDTKMKDVLQAIDRAIYSGKTNLNIQKSFDALKSYTQERYQVKVEELKNG